MRSGTFDRSSIASGRVGACEKARGTLTAASASIAPLLPDVMNLPTWSLLAIALIPLLAGVGIGQWWSTTRRRGQPLPTEWPLMARPVLNDEERRAFRALKEALPQHIVLAKLPLVRLCQLRDDPRPEYWYRLIGSLHVSFVVCNANGRVLVVVDLDSERTSSRRALAIKQAVLDACRIRFLHCTPDTLPGPTELQLLLPTQGSVARAVPMSPQAVHLQSARSTLTDTVKARRAERSTRWVDSSLPPDSFFAPDSQLDGPVSEFPPAAAANAAPHAVGHTPLPST